MFTSIDDRPDRPVRQPMCCVPVRWFLHDNVIPLLQVSDEVVRNDFCHEVVAMSEAAAAVSLKGQTQCKPKFVGIGGRQLGGVIAHPGRLDQPWRTKQEPQGQSARWKGARHEQQMART